MRPHEKHGYDSDEGGLGGVERIPGRNVCKLSGVQGGSRAMLRPSIRCDSRILGNSMLGGVYSGVGGEASQSVPGRSEDALRRDAEPGSNRAYLLICHVVLSCEHLKLTVEIREFLARIRRDQVVDLHVE